MGNLLVIYAKDSLKNIVTAVTEIKEKDYIPVKMISYPSMPFTYQVNPINYRGSD